MIDEIGEVEGACIDIDYQVAVEAERETNWDSDTVGFGLRQYTYQLCTQLGWYHSSNSNFQPFGSSFSADFRHTTCADIFDLYELMMNTIQYHADEIFSLFLFSYSRDQLVSNIARFNTVRGGLNPGASNVYYTHGQLDPTRSIGVQVTHFESAPSLVILGEKKNYSQIIQREMLIL